MPEARLEARRQQDLLSLFRKKQSSEFILFKMSIS